MELAGQVVEISSLFESTRDYCRDYLTEKAPHFFVAPSREDLAAEQVFLDQEAQQEGLRRRKFSDPFLERNFLQRRIARLLLDREILLLHGSAVALDGKGYLFVAPCGTGKSTHARLWRETLGAETVNDDKPFVRLTPEGALLCGSPWTGKHGLGQNLTVPLAGICLLARGLEDRITLLPAADALPLLLRHGCAPEDAGGKDRLESLLQRLSRAVPLWFLQCTPTPEAALTAHKAMSASTQ